MSGKGKMTKENTWSIEDIASYYAEYAKTYDSEIEPETYPAPFLISSWVMEVLCRSEGPVNILDVGVGTGQSSKPFFSHPQHGRFAVYGMDATKEMLDVARSYPFKSLHLRNVEEPFSLGVKFHAAVSVGLLDFIIDKRRLLFEVALHLHSGAIFGLTLPESDDLDALKQFQQNYKDAGFTALRHEKLFGYSDSKTGQDVYYHGFLLQI